MPKYYHIYKGDKLRIPRNHIGQIIKTEYDLMGQEKVFLKTLTGKQKVVTPGELHEVISAGVTNLSVCPRCGSGMQYKDQVYGIGGFVVGCAECMDPNTGMVRLF